MRINPEYFLKPFVVSSYRPVAYLVVLMLLTSLASLLYAPVLMPDSYDWIVHTTSESGAQGITGSWLARLGFLLFGLAVLLLTLALRHHWGRLAFIMHSGFGICMVGNAVFSSRPWVAELPFDFIEDLLHSWMSGLVGTAFSIGVLAMLFQRQTTDRFSLILDWVVLGTAIIISIAMMFESNLNGLIQRVMFLAAYLWYGKETIVVARSGK